MKKIIIILASITLLFDQVACYSQTSIPYKRQHSFAYPIFSDNKKFAKDLFKDDAIRSRYFDLKRDHDYETYRFGFNVTRSGQVISSDSVIDSTIKNFVENKFTRYHWIPGYSRANPHEKKTSYCVLTISLIPNNKRVYYNINAGDGNFKTHARIITDKEIKME